jgi:hypothetical protein
MITCKFTCHGCRLIDHPFNVRAREQREPVVAWLEFVVRPAMSAAHDKASPWCKSGNADLKVPLHGELIGGAVAH